MLLVLVLMVSGLTTLLLVVSASAWAYATRLMLGVVLVLCILLSTLAAPCLVLLLYGLSITTGVYIDLSWSLLV